MNVHRLRTALVALCIVCRIQSSLAADRIQCVAVSSLRHLFPRSRSPPHARLSKHATHLPSRPRAASCRDPSTAGFSLGLRPAFGKLAGQPSIQHLSWEPRSWVYKHFLTPEECDHIIATARRRPRGCFRCPPARARGPHLPTSHQFCGNSAHSHSALPSRESSDASCSHQSRRA